LEKGEKMVCEIDNIFVRNGGIIPPPSGTPFGKGREDGL
jgi:hypothetical protein